MNRGRIISAAVAALGAIGLGLSFLPWITITVSERMLTIMSGRYFFRMLVEADGESPAEHWKHMCEVYQEYCPGGGGAEVSLNVFDFIGSSYFAAGLLPITLALAIAIGAMQAWRRVDTRVMAFLALLSLGALVALTFTALNPSMAISGSGEFDTPSAPTESLDPSDLSLGVGPGLYLPAVVLGLIFALATWQTIVGLRDEVRGSGAQFVPPPQPLATNR
ncbi:hypothetical protein [Gordonia sp. (in: high G+C Gram-positive bacteria)]|uniref:hypothetical protein n=1 Tax=Gordonia sp. (in: high G+C Gram-positive bacteria) TaxID=84139 RepID=UPI003C74B372